MSDAAHACRSTRDQPPRCAPCPDCCGSAEDVVPDLLGEHRAWVAPRRGAPGVPAAGARPQCRCAVALHATGSAGDPDTGRSGSVRASISMCPPLSNPPPLSPAPFKPHGSKCLGPSPPFFVSPHSPSTALPPVCRSEPAVPRLTSTLTRLASVRAATYRTSDTSGPAATSPHSTKRESQLLPFSR
jgi:hypothetical protein